MKTLNGLRLETSTVFRLCRNSRSAIRLLWETFWFHIENKLNRHIWPGGDRPFAVEIRLSNLNPTVWLRRWGGDIFIFYEVLGGHAYAVTPGSLGVREVHSIVDCGGNIGITTLFFADRFPQARIVSVEPMPANFAMLRKNTSGIPRIQAVHGCVSDTNGTRTMTTDQPAWGNRVSADGNGVTVPAFTVNELMKQHNLERIDLLKMDVEGEEATIMRNAEFLKVTGLMLIEIHWPYSYPQFQQDVNLHGMVSATPEERPDLPCTTAWRSV